MNFHEVEDSYSDEPSSELTEEDLSTQKSKFSLSHYFSTATLAFGVLMIAGTIILFIWSNTSLGAYVTLSVSAITPNNNTLTMHDLQTTEYISVSMADTQNKELISLLLKNIISEMYNETYSSLETSNLINELLPMKTTIFSFSLISSVNDFWQSKAYGLALLIAIFSGIWPYIKLVLLMVCWLKPMSQPFRLKIIILLDQLGKFSYIDLFISLYMIVTFYVTISEETKSYYGLNITIEVQPAVGLNTFVIGTAISLIFSHVFLFIDINYAQPHMLRIKKREFENAMAADFCKEQQIMHRNESMRNEFGLKSKNVDKSMEENEFGVKSKNDYFIDNKSQMKNELLLSEKLVFPQWLLGMKPLAVRLLPTSMCGVLLRTVILTCVLFSVWGTLESAFTSPVKYEIKGLAGWAIGNSAIRSYSAWDIVKEVPSKTDEKLAAVLLSATFFTTIILCPILLSLMLIAVWFLPTNHRYLSYFYHGIQICLAWSSLDVYLIASFASSAELERVSRWIIDQNYAEICGANGIIPVHMRGVDCFRVDGTVIYGSWVVLATVVAVYAIIIYTLYQIFVVRKSVSEAIEKKDKSDLGLLQVN